MALNKTVKVDKIEIVGDYKHVQVRTATIVDEEGTELNRSFHRHVLDPGTVGAGTTALTPTDISGQEAEVQAICTAAWTDAVKEAWRVKLIADRVGIGTA